jgi:hypothetical protein
MSVNLETSSQLRVPELLTDAVASGAWRDPGPETLRRVFHHVANLPDLELFADVATMQGVGQQVSQAGFAEIDDFCMVRKASELAGTEDPRIALDSSLFLGGSIVPGDDVFVVLDLRDAEDGQVLVFDWEREVPRRWVAVGSLRRVLEAL